MSEEEINKRERKIRSNFASISLLMTAIAVCSLVGILYLVKLL